MAALIRPGAGQAGESEGGGGAVHGAGNDDFPVLQVGIGPHTVLHGNEFREPAAAVDAIAGAFAASDASGSGACAKAKIGMTARAG